MSDERKKMWSNRLFELVRFSAHQIDKARQWVTNISSSLARSGHSFDKPVGATWGWLSRSAAGADLASSPGARSSSCDNDVSGWPG